MFIFKYILSFFLFYSSSAFCFDLSLYFTNVSSIDDRNVDELKVVYRCHKTTSGLLALFDSHAENEIKACADWEQKAWYKAKEYCEKKSLKFNEIRRSTEISKSSNLICTQNDCSTSLGYGDQIDTEVKFECTENSPINQSHEEAQKKIKEEHAALQKNVTPIQKQSKKIYRELECIAKTREILKIDGEFSELFNTANLTRIEMIYDQQNHIIKSRNSKLFYFHNTLTKHLKFSQDISAEFSNINNLVIFNDKNVQIKTDCSYK